MNSTYLEYFWPADVVHGALGVESEVALLPDEGRGQVQPLGEVEVRRELLQLRVGAPVPGLVAQEHLRWSRDSQRGHNCGPIVVLVCVSVLYPIEASDDWQAECLE